MLYSDEIESRGSMKKINQCLPKWVTSLEEEASPFKESSHMVGKMCI